MDYVEILSRQSEHPVPAIRDGIVVAWQNTLDGTERSPNRDRTLLERNFLLLDVGVKLVNPSWWGELERDTWYVDLVKVEQRDRLYVIRDLYLDLVVPTDGRPYRSLDLHEFGDALEQGNLSVADAVDGLRRWQQFLDKYLHTTGNIHTAAQWSNFPPKSLEFFASLSDDMFQGSGVRRELPGG